jgi:hypothetical protein
MHLPMLDDIRMVAVGQLDGFNSEVLQTSNW